MQEKNRYKNKREKQKIVVLAEEEWSSYLFKGESSHLGLSNLSLSNK
jgi:hypothetical protein